ncbi:MAG TPA: hypothetical protein VL242_14580 [Sorangium sp.]|nr:hypothetical protein [Sorangium sp.]
MDGGRRGDVTVAGPRTRALFKDATGVARAVMLQFKPGWSAPLLGVAASALTDRNVPLEDIWGRSGGDLCLDLLAARKRERQGGRVHRAQHARSLAGPLRSFNLGGRTMKCPVLPRHLDQQRGSRHRPPG